MIEKDVLGVFHRKGMSCHQTPDLFCERFGGCFAERSLLSLEKTLISNFCLKLHMKGRLLTSSGEILKNKFLFFFTQDFIKQFDITGVHFLVLCLCNLFVGAVRSVENKDIFLPISLEGRL